MAPSRREEIRRLQRGLDVLVIGGGITGAGVALDAATRGYSVGLVERRDYASATSSRSTKLVHGGIRYLPQGHLALVKEGVRERARLLRVAPHIVRPLRFIVPLYRETRRPLGVRIPALLAPFAPLGIRMGLTAYDFFARSPQLRHQSLSRARLREEAPDLRTEGLRAALAYYDARTDDVRLTHAVLATARAFGATTLNYADAVGIMRSGDATCGARVVDRQGGGTIEVGARFVVNATGIWGEQVASLERSPGFRIKHSSGAHAVLRPGSVKLSSALVIPETDDGRLAFIVPWAGRYVLGTTDDAYTGDLEAPAATGREIDYLIEHANRYLDRRIGRGDVTAAFSGVRPLVAASGPTAALARDHHVEVSPAGLISIVGGKLTGYRKMAEDTVDAIVSRDGGKRPCRTKDLELAGASGLAEAAAALAALPLAEDQRSHLLDWYGSRCMEIAGLIKGATGLAARLIPGAAQCRAEVIFSCRHEGSVSLADCMFLGTRIASVDAEAADSAAGTVAELMARELGWSPEEVAREREAYEARAEVERAWIRS